MRCIIPIFFSKSALFVSSATSHTWAITSRLFYNVSDCAASSRPSIITSISLYLVKAFQWNLAQNGGGHCWNGFQGHGVKGRGHMCSLQLCEWCDGDASDLQLSSIQSCRDLRLIGQASLKPLHKRFHTVFGPAILFSSLMLHNSKTTKYHGHCVSQILSYYVYTNALCHLLNKRILIDWLSVVSCYQWEILLMWSVWWLRRRRGSSVCWCWS